MSLLIYRFDDLKRFPLLDDWTTARGLVERHIEDDAWGRLLCLTYAASLDDPSDAVLALALPVRAVSGGPEELQLAVLGDGHKWWFELQGWNADGQLMDWCWGTTACAGRQTCAVAVDTGTARLVGSVVTGAQCVTVPLEFYRLNIRPPAGVGKSRIGLRSLSVTGSAWPVPAGVA
ncbi:MAG TPA: hypothetical protein PKK06_10955 [Phycisphaerae bacterium]|nr:hypothetical protein [Phycisphaerae bacterium]HNU44334.1 hypothetical protein [Phycisphaerae bacterium]